MSNFIEHARRELMLIGEEQETIDWYLRVIKEFASFGHSGGSHSVTVPILNKLLCFQNLTPITDDPDEWIYHREDIWGEPGGAWQNIRNSRIFSLDGGVTYYNVEEDAAVAPGRVYYTSEHKEKQNA